MSDDDKVNLTQFPEVANEWANTSQIILSLLPAPFSGAAAVISALTPELNRRRIEWLEYVGSSLKHLQERMDTPDLEALFRQPEFYDAFMHISHIALSTSQRKKHRLLRNILLNVAAGKAPRDDLLPTLLTLMAAITPCQMQLLQFFYEPQQFGIESISELDYPYRNGSAREEALKRVACLNGQSFLYEHYVTLLTAQGLMETSQPAPDSREQQIALRLDQVRAAYITHELRAPRTTAIAQQLIILVLSPLPDLDEDDTE